MTSNGYVYLITHPKFVGWVKIGKAVDPHKRLRQYQTGDPERSYRLMHIEPAQDRHEAEFNAIERLTRLGYERSGEWFRVGIETAKAVLRKAVR